VDLRDYSRKLSERSTRFEAWAGDLLVGLLAAYFNDGPPRCAFISNVSVLPEWRSRGVAPTLLEHCIAHARAERAAFIALEVGAANRPARRLYERYGFQPEADAEAEAPAALDASDATLRLRLALNPEGIP
jgi:ribosomal protein S18 acetylase RimI-like enzyme